MIYGRDRCHVKETTQGGRTPARYPSISGWPDMQLQVLNKNPAPPGPLSSPFIPCPLSLSL